MQEVQSIITSVSVMVHKKRVEKVNGPWWTLVCLRSNAVLPGGEGSDAVQLQVIGSGVWFCLNFSVFPSAEDMSGSDD